MRSWLRVFLVVVLAAGALAVPALDPPQPAPAAAVDAPAMAVCAFEEGSGRSSIIGVVSTVDGAGVLTAFAAGSAVGSLDFETGESGAWSVPVADVAAVGVGGALLEFPAASSATASVVVGADSLSIDTCPAEAGGELILGGGSTLSDQRFEVQLMNPYAGQAILNLTVQSDGGLESNTALDSVIVPARSTVLVDLAEILPGREWMTVAIAVEIGGVLAGGRFGIGTDNAIWDAVAPAQEWFIPVSHGLESRQVVVAAGEAEVEYQVDFYGPEGLVEGFETGVIPGRGQAVVDIGGVTPIASAIRVVTTGPVGAFLRVTSETGVAMTSGSTTPASGLLLPGAGSVPGGSGWITLFNPGLEDVGAEVTTLRSVSETVAVSVPAGGVVEVATAPDPALGYTIEGDGVLVASWSASIGGSIGVASACPIIDE
ncbi:MAG TPA: DUF5719 family protein [Acidimicrobiia bacterium]|nr:DUF5719 family protein [Acidimicrobiia bacterium]